ncbi:MAG TPA: DUF4261 domain-containing protein [Gemmataceae bacterium]|nr:DUF4261 domain-containing protein [Gemmataceae bacterium]
MPIDLKCDNAECGKRMRLKDEAAGKKVKCSGCGRVLTVPAVQNEDGPVDLALRLMGHESESARRHGQPVYNAKLEDPACLQVLFDTPPNWRTADLMRPLREYDPTMSRATFEVGHAGDDNQAAYGLAAWGKHVVRFLAFDAPIPATVLECCVDPAHYKQAMKQRARASRAHALLYYGGYEKDVLENYVALAAVAGALAGFDASVVTNESGHSSLPAGVLVPGQTDGDQMELLRSLPLLHLYCGFVKYEVKGVDGVWMRSYGADKFGLPDLAFLADGHQQGEDTFEIFSNILGYLRESGAELAAGHTMQVGPDMFVRLREREKGEYFLESEGDLFVLERIDESDTNVAKRKKRH